MNNTMTYKGYLARIDYDANDRIFTGRVLGINDIVVFDGTTVDEIEQRLHEMLDFYLESSQQAGRPPQKPYSGKLMLRIPPEIHARAAMLAEAQGKSLNQWVADLLARQAQD
jgi:predicted HicB family RNase H-like nuclease